MQIKCFFVLVVFFFQKQKRRKKFYISDFKNQFCECSKLHHSLARTFAKAPQYLLDFSLSQSQVFSQFFFSIFFFSIFLFNSFSEKKITCKILLISDDIVDLFEFSNFPLFGYRLESKLIKIQSIVKTEIQKTSVEIVEGDFSHKEHTHTHT